MPQWRLQQAVAHAAILTPQAGRRWYVEQMVVAVLFLLRAYVGPMLQVHVRAEMGAPVAGINVVQHFETNVLPLKAQVRLPRRCCRVNPINGKTAPQHAQISMAFVNDVVEFFTPPPPSAFAAQAKRDAPQQRATPSLFDGGTPSPSPQVLAKREHATLMSGVGEQAAVAGTDSVTLGAGPATGAESTWGSVCAGAFPAPAVLSGRLSRHAAERVGAAAPQLSHGDAVTSTGGRVDPGEASARGAVSTGDLSAMKQRAATILTFKYVRIGAVIVELSFKGTCMPWRRRGAGGFWRQCNARLVTHR